MSAETTVRKIVVVLVVAAILTSANVFAQESAPNRPKIGLALSGGGAKGYAHIGVLKALEEMKIPVDYIAGTSMGAVVGALYASGMSPAELEQVAASIDWTDALQDEQSYDQLSWRGKDIARRYASGVEFGIKGRRIAMTSGFRTGQKLRFLLSRHLLPTLTTHDFDALPIPFRAVAADLETGEPVVLSRGDLPAAVRASMSMPGVFTPVELDGRILVDGGVAMNLPAEVVRAMGADVVIAVDIGAPLESRDKLKSTLSIFNQLSTMLMQANIESQLRQADVVIQPAIEGFGTYDFDRYPEIVPLGSAAAVAHRDALSQYAVSDAEYAAIAARQRNVPPAEIAIDRITISGESHVDERVIRRLMRSRAGASLDIDVLEQDIARIYGLGEFVAVEFAIRPSDGKSVLDVSVHEKSWGPHYGRFGFNMTATESDDVKIQLLGGLTSRRVNARGGEWRLDLAAGEEPRLFTEFLQPLDFDGLHFVALSGSAVSREVELMAGGDPVALYDVDERRITADYGVRLANHGEVRIGLVQRWVEAHVTLGSPLYEDLEGDDAGVHVTLGIDTLDNPFVPRDGWAGLLEGFYVLEALGSDYEYGRADIHANAFKTWHRHTVMTGFNAGSWLGTTMPSYDAFALGGFLNLSAFDPGRHLGQAAAVARLGYYAKVADPGAPFARGVYAGVVAEAGNVFPSLREATSEGLLWSGMAFAAVDSAFGPIYLGYAIGAEHENNFYLTIGRTF